MHRLIKYIAIILAILPRNVDSQDEFEKWLKEEQKKINQYMSEQEKQFATYLDKTWERLDAMDPLETGRKPKPQSLPVFQPPKPIREQPKRKSPIKSVPTPMKKQPPKPIKKVKEPSPKPKQAMRDKSGLSVMYFGNDLNLPFDPAMKIMISKVNKRGVKKYWESMAKTNWEPTLKKMEDYRTELHLNDWSFGYLVQDIAEKLYGSRRNEAYLFVWFMMLQDGYDMKIGLGHDRVYLLLSSEQLIYGLPYYVPDGNNVRYFLFDFHGVKQQTPDKLVVYPGQFVTATNQCDFRLKQIPNFKSNIYTREKTFSYEGEKYSVTTSVNADVVALLEYYPSVDVGVYFQSDNGKESQSDLLNSLKNIIASRSERDAVNIILRFVQTAFDYKTDEEQFGREKSLFPDETLFYPFSDCEDRAIMFSFLVEEILGYDVIGLKYPNHISTAVRFEKPIKGDSFEFRGGRYTACDPTYINSNVGMTIPQFKNVRPEIISIR